MYCCYKEGLEYWGNISDMINNSDFQPVGPLKYLLFDHRGSAVLGLYIYKQTGNLVMIGKMAGKKIVYWPSENALNRCLEDKMTLTSLLNKSKITLTDLTPLTALDLLIVRIYNRLIFHSPISRQKYHIAYPNYYYLYREFLFNQEMSSSVADCK